MRQKLHCVGKKCLFQISSSKSESHSYYLLSKDSYLFLIKSYQSHFCIFHSETVTIIRSLVDLIPYFFGFYRMMKNGKQSSQPEKGSSRILSLTVLFIALCGFSFYLGGMFCSERVKIEANDVTSTTTKAVASPMKPTVSPLQIKSVSFPECSSELQDYTPCTDPKVHK